MPQVHILTRHRHCCTEVGGERLLRQGGGVSHCFQLFYSRYTVTCLQLQLLLNISTGSKVPLKLGVPKFVLSLNLDPAVLDWTDTNRFFVKFCSLL